MGRPRGKYVNGSYDMDDGTKYFKRVTDRRPYKRIGNTVERVEPVLTDKWEPATTEDDADYWVYTPTRVGA